jgi:hypothetical protein
MRPVIDGHNDVLTRLADAGAPDDALLREDAAAVTVPRAAAGGLAAGLFAVLPPVGPLMPERSRDGYQVPLSSAVPWPGAARTVGALAGRL